MSIEKYIKLREEAFEEGCEIEFCTEKKIKNKEDLKKVIEGLTEKDEIRMSYFLYIIYIGKSEGIYCLSMSKGKKPEEVVSRKEKIEDFFNDVCRLFDEMLERS